MPVDQGVRGNNFCMLVRELTLYLVRVHVNIMLSSMKKSSYISDRIIFYKNVSNDRCQTLDIMVTILCLKKKILILGADSGVTCFRKGSIARVAILKHPKWKCC